MRRTTATTPSSLTAIVADYRKRFGLDRKAHLDRYRAMPDLKTATRNAGLALRDDGKREAHQRRITSATLRAFERALQRRAKRIAAARSFEALFLLVGESMVPGIGPLTHYDTALRVGAFLGLEPEAVYVHAGAAKGARELDLPIVDGRVERRDLPPPLRRLAPDEVEDCLCIYKGSLRYEQLPPRRSVCAPMKAWPRRIYW